MNKRLRIAQIAPLWTRVPPETYGGIELGVHLLAEELLRRGHDVTLYAAGDARTNARLHAVCDINLMQAMQEGVAFDYHPYMNSQVADVLREAEEFDILHAHVGCEWMPFSTAARRPLLHTMRTKLSTDEIWLLLRYLEIPVVAISHSQISALPEERRKTIPIIYNSVDFNSYDFSPAMGTHLAFLGRMAPHKGPVQAIEIARKVGLPILLGGAPACGLEASFFAAEVNPLIDGKNIVYIGPVDHAAKCELLRNAAALLFPIQWEEPFGLVMIEAMACGTPVVACRRGSVPEVVESGVTGLYGETADDLVPLVSQAMSFDRSEVRARSKSRFHFIHMVDDYETLYGKLIGSR